jgi:hypothetical protein
MTHTVAENAAPTVSEFVPQSVEQAREWVLERISLEQSIRIHGNGTSGHSDPISLEEGGCFPVSSQDLKSIHFFDPDDLVAGMQAGQTAAEMQQLLAQKKMQLMVNPWYPDSTLGGMVSANISGPNRMNMGGLRDSLIGIEYINGRGELVKAGGKVVKNVTGYDLTRMMIGHLGGLGLITSVNFKIQPFVIDPHALFLETDLQNWQKAVGLLQSRRIPLDWIQAVSASAEGNRILLGAGFSGNPERRSRIANELQDVFGEKSFMLADGDDSPEWPCLPGKERFNGFLPAYLEHWQINQPGLHLQASLPTADILELSLESLSAWDPRMIIHPVGGDLHLFLGEQDGDRQKKFIQTLLKCLPRQSSNMRLLRSAPEVGFEHLGHFAKPPGYSLSCRLKQHLDSEELFDAPYYRM